ncbi:hypothetical protein [Pontibacter pamirensis]|uniref:hypothetical protein n=1 Tax=Pontibacter pamirensis TaxID=2562824 RepID=UPI001389EE3A|nr:hypothetical protein [Pontibacter pamirensis]
MKKIFILPLLFLSFLWQPAATYAQFNRKASVAFSYMPDESKARYSQRVPHKTIAVGNDEFVVLSRSSADAYTVEKYSDKLKKQWTAEVKLAGTETLEAFAANQEAAIVVTHRADNDQGQQQLYGHRVDLRTGKKQESVLLLEASVKSRRASVSISEDATKLLAYRYYTNSSHQIQDISGTLYDGKLQKIDYTSYNLQDTYNILSADVQVSNSGQQYISLISDNMKRLTSRLYTPGSEEVRVMSVLVGGVFSGTTVYILDSKFELMHNGTLYGAVMTAEEPSGRYYSLKTVKFDFEAEDMIFAEEFRFTPDYISQVNALDKSSGGKTGQLEDIYLSDLFLTPEQQLIVMAEKKYTAGGKDAPYFAKELHLFTYDEYMNKDWNSVLMKHQQAPADEAFSSISYNAYLSGNTLHLLTLEELKGKHDLYLRQVDANSGEASAPKAVGLNIANDKDLAYVKDFTAWLSEKNIIAVARPSRKADELRLSKIQLK